jgi:phage tail sheath protein FI
MAETLVSPGVLATEIDTSFVSSRPVQAGAAIIGPTVKGPVNIPTLVTSWSDYQNKFGTTLISSSTIYTYFTSIAAYNYFNNGGTSLLVARVVSGTFAPATSSIYQSGSTTVESFKLHTLSEGIEQNSSSSLGTNGVLFSGSADNIRWQVTTVNTASGTFSLLIRRGDDNDLNPNVLEQWNNLSLDPFASNYIAKQIGDQTQTLKTSDGYYLQTTGSYAGGSRYVRVSNIANTPNYLNSNGTISVSSYSASLPAASTGSFSGATGTIMAGAKFYDQIISANAQGLSSSYYNNMINLLANKDDYQYNIIMTPGLCDNLTGHSDQINTIISNCQDRGDCIYIADMADYGQTTSTVVTKAQTKNTSYAATYWPWVQVQDPNSGQNVWVPASTVIGGVYAYNDSVSEPWFAPAGINRGGLNTVLQAERKLPQGTRDTLYQGKVNPIATFPGQGIVVYGQKTLQTRASALDRVNVRRLLIALKSYISQVANTLVFEQNSTATRNNFLAQVNPYLENVQQRQGLYAFKVIMDESNNTADVIDRNELIGQIYVQPTKTAEFIYLDFIVTPTGASFPA